MCFSFNITISNIRGKGIKPSITTHMILLHRKLDIRYKTEGGIILEDILINKANDISPAMLKDPRTYQTFRRLSHTQILPVQ